MTSRAFSEYFRCPDDVARFETVGTLSEHSGFFQFGSDAVCYGQHSGAVPSKNLHRHLVDASRAVSFSNGRVLLPFDFSQVIDNLRLERYTLNSNHILKRASGWSATRWGYYFLRPILPVRVRKHLQRVYLKGWDKILFPRWPVDFSVECLMRQTMALILKAQRKDKIPFIWFWPAGSPSCLTMTHDVESEIGSGFCNTLMDLDDSFGIKASFEVIPEERYVTSEDFLKHFRDRGFEINVHDLSHDGSLFRERHEFVRKAEEINRYVTKFRAEGFRSGSMYRNTQWYESFDFSYDMSVPNVAHLEPQQGGCCTVMPYFIGKLVELPLTTTQDYSLFHILGDYSIDLWKQEIELILEHNGLISFITHPDYLIEPRARSVYLDLLAHIARLRAERKLWLALPAQINRWFRNRSQMKLVQSGGSWKIEGPGSEQARVAYASLENDRTVYSVEEPASVSV